VVGWLDRVGNLAQALTQKKQPDQLHSFPTEQTKDDYVKWDAHEFEIHKVKGGKIWN
jgi:hypothetical protein